MTIITSITLGVVEGLTEFLPISSTGHLILTSHLLNIPATNFSKSFEIFIQLGAILAVVVLYWRDLLVNREVMKRVIVAFLPTAIIGLALYKIVKTYLLDNLNVVVASLFVGGIILIIFELWHQKQDQSLRGEASQLEDITYKQCLSLGLFQSLAMIPGVSRSASTIIGGLLLGLKRETIVEFSFLLAVPTMVAATGLDLFKSSINFSISEWGMLAIGFVVSFLVALLAIKTFLAYIRQHNFISFGIYRIIIAGIFFALFLV